MFNINICFHHCNIMDTKKKNHRPLDMLQGPHVTLITSIQWALLELKKPKQKHNPKNVHRDLSEGKWTRATKSAFSTVSLFAESKTVKLMLSVCFLFGCTLHNLKLPGKTWAERHVGKGQYWKHTRKSFSFIGHFLQSSLIGFISSSGWRPGSFREVVLVCICV